MKKSILIITAVFIPEPIVSARLSEDIANELSLSYKVFVLAPNPTRPFGFKFQIDQSKQLNYSLINLKSYTCPESSFLGRLRESYSFGIACKKYISNNFNNIDVIYMNSWPIFSQYIISLTALKYSIPLLTHVQDLYPESLSSKIPFLSPLFNTLLKPLDVFTLKNSKIVIAISQKMKIYLSKTRKLPEHKIKVIQNWQNEESFISFNQKKNKSKSLFTFMYLGNIGPVAGLDLIIKAFVEANIIDSKLIIAGAGSKKEELQNEVRKREILNIDFLEVPKGKVPEIQSFADVMLLPIKKGAASSSIPSKLPAYMFSKKPILASVDIDSDSAKVINESKSGWVIEPENVYVLTKKMREVYLTKKSELDLKGENGFNFAMKNLSRRNNLKQLVKVILDCKL